MQLIETEAQLEDALSTPGPADIDLMRRLSGNLIIAGAAGKMGLSLAHRAQRAAEAAGASVRVIAVSRFSTPQSRAEFTAAGIATISCDLLDRTATAQLPDSENILFLAGRKFGSSDRQDLTWASNTLIPANIAERYRQARIVVFSTGNVYPFVSPDSGGSVETDAPDPRGEYANSCLARERVFEYYSREFGMRCLLFRLNYATDLRYGVLTDIARKVYDNQPVDLTVPAFNTIWQGDANSYALRSLELCEMPPRILNVTGEHSIRVNEVAKFFARRFGRKVKFTGNAAPKALLSNAETCHRLLGRPTIDESEQMELVIHWIKCGGRSLNKPTKFEVTDGKF